MWLGLGNLPPILLVTVRMTLFVVFLLIQGLGLGSLASTGLPGRFAKANST
jgi:hypothetical protein